MKTALQLPKLTYQGHEKSKMTLHLFLQVMGKIRLSGAPRKNHWWYITEYIDTQGFSTGPIPYNNGLSTFTLTLNVHKHSMDVVNSHGKQKSFDLAAGVSVADFYNQLIDILGQLDIPVSIYDRPFDQTLTKPFKEITEYKDYDPSYTSKLWQTFVWVDGVFKEFSGRFYGKTCPVHLYWHSLDLAVTRFSGKKAPTMPKEARLSDKDAYTHECISFGFWGGDDKMPEPAFYSYTYPSPKGIEKEPLPANASWIDSNGSGMAILTYSNLTKEANPREALLDFMESGYQAGAKLAGWDIKELTVPDLKEL